MHNLDGSAPGFPGMDSRGHQLHKHQPAKEGSDCYSMDVGTQWVLWEISGLLPLTDTPADVILSPQMIKNPDTREHEHKLAALSLWGKSF